MVVVRQSASLSNPLVPGCTLQARTVFQLTDQSALYLLPRHLTRRMAIAARAVERRAASIDFFGGQQSLQTCLAQIDAYAIARSHQRDRRAQTSTPRACTQCSLDTPTLVSFIGN